MIVKSLMLSLALLVMAFNLSDAQVCDDLVDRACETAVGQGWIKIRPCNSGGVSIQYCHPRLYIGSGHNLSVKGSMYGTIVFDDLLDKTTLSSGLKVRKAIGKNGSGKIFTGIFTYNDGEHIQNCYIRSGADRSSRIVLPE